MNKRLGQRGKSRMVRHLLAAGFTLSTAYAFGVFTLGGCGGASWPSKGQLPERVVERLTECGKKGPIPLEPVRYNLTFTVHVAENNVEASIDEVVLTDSTLHIDEVEDCMTDALYGMRTPLEALAFRRRKLAPDMAVAPEARALFGQAQLALLLEAAEIVVVGYAAYSVVVYFLVTKPYTKPRPAPARPQAEDPPKPEPPKPGAQTEGEPKTTDPPPPPPPPPRRYPNQTCDDGELDRLENEKKRLCGSGYAANCSPSKVSKEKLERIPCSAIKRSIEQRLACLRARNLVQEKCFGGVPDAGHKNAIDEVQNGIDKCEALKLINCAKGHPQAGF
jgi:hypothetical protein